jgi:hypothetical protein
MEKKLLPDDVISVATAKQYCREANTEDLKALRTTLVRKQAGMSLSKLIQSCRITDTLYSELRRRDRLSRPA